MLPSLSLSPLRRLCFILVLFLKHPFIFFVCVTYICGSSKLQVPHPVAEKWRGICDHAMNEGLEDDGPVLGHLKIGTVEDEKKGPQTQINLALDNENTIHLPQEYAMRNVARSDAPALFAFSGINGHMSCEGVVQHRLDVVPRGTAKDIDPAYRKLSRERNQAASSRARTVQVVEGRSITNIRQPVAAAEAERRRKAEEGKRAALPRDELEAQLFRLFERQAYWSFAQIQKQTAQPTQHLKSVLSGIAMQTKRGPYKDLWGLKREFKVGDSETHNGSDM